MRVLIISVLILTIAWPVEAGLFGRRRSRVCTTRSCAPVKKVVAPVVKQQVVVPQTVTQNNFFGNQTEYAYQTPLLGASPAVIEQHKFLASTAQADHTATAAQALQYNQDVLRNERMRMVLEAGKEDQTGPLASLNVINPGTVTQSNTTSILNTKCAQCHGAGLASPKGELFLTEDMDDTTMLNALEAVRNDTMPKGAPLTDEEKAAFMEELMNLRKK